MQTASELPRQRFIDCIVKVTIVEDHDDTYTILDRLVELRDREVRRQTLVDAVAFLRKKQKAEFIISTKNTYGEVIDWLEDLAKLDAEAKHGVS